MELKKKSLAKFAMMGAFAIVVLGLTDCSGRSENQDSPTEITAAEQRAGGSSRENEQMDISIFDDFPEWWRDATSEEEKQMILDVLTAEELEDFKEQIEEWGSSIQERTQHVIVRPGDDSLTIGEENGLLIIGEEEAD